MTDYLKTLNGLVQPVDGLLTVHEWQERALQAEAKLLRIASKATALQEENQQLQRNYRRQRPTYDQISHRAKHDCELMFALFLSGYETTRDRCLDELGISRRRWNWARALAQLSGVHDGTEFYSHLSMAEVIRRLREGVAVAEKQPVMLRSFMPKNGGPTRTGGTLDQWTSGTVGHLSLAAENGTRHRETIGRGIDRGTGVVERMTRHCPERAERTGHNGRAVV